MSKFCPNCGTQLDDNAKFCMKCGQKLEPDKKKTRKKYIAMAIAGLVVIGAVGFWADKNYFGQQAPASAPSKQTAAADTAAKTPEMTSDLSLGGLDLDLTLDEMHERLGQEESSKQEDNHMYYFYEGLKVGSTNNKLTSLVSDNDKVATKRGLHQGDSYDDMVKAYGSSYNKMEYNGQMLYEYSFQSLDGKNGILRFAVSEDTNKIAYISVRIPEENANKAKQTAKASSDTIDVTYTGGKTTQLHLSQNSIEMHVGQKLHLYPGDNSGEAGVLRLMTDNNRDKMGIVTPKNCVSVTTAGKTGGKGSSTEKIITANAPGEAVFTVVPNYGSWDNAAKIFIRIVN